MLFGQMKETMEIAKELISYGSLGILVAVGVGIAIYLLVKVYVPAYRASHAKDIEVKDSLIANVTSQTETLKTVQQTLTSHDATCRSQSNESCDKIVNIEAAVNAHSEAIVRTVENVRQAFREHNPELGRKINIEDKCNDIVLVVRNTQAMKTQ